MSPDTTVRIGVVSDTHGFLDDGVREVLRGVTAIVHAGDVGSIDVLSELETIAPVHAVRGNTDAPGPPLFLRDSMMRTFAGTLWLVAHRPQDVVALARSAGADVVVAGHTHRPLIQREHGWLFVNPGSASRPRGPEGPTVAIVEISEAGVAARIVPVSGV